MILADKNQLLEEPTMTETTYSRPITLTDAEFETIIKAVMWAVDKAGDIRDELHQHHATATEIEGVLKGLHGHTRRTKSSIKKLSQRRPDLPLGDVREAASGLEKAMKDSHRKSIKHMEATETMAHAGDNYYDAIENIVSALRAVQEQGAGPLRELGFIATRDRRSRTDP